MIIVKNRELLIPRNEQYIGTPNDNNADNRVFRISRLSQTGEDLSGLTYRLDLLYPDKRNVYTVSAVTSRSGRSVVVLTTLFARQYPAAGTYTFSFDGTNWKHNNENVTLSEVGIIIAYNPVSGDTVTVTSTIQQVITDTVLLSKEITDEYINLTWTVTAAQLAIPGTVYVTLRGANDDAEVRWASFQGAFYVEQNNYTPAMFTGPMSELEYFEQVLSSNLVKLEYLPTKYEELEDAVEDAEAWAKGTRSGSAVPQEDDTYHNNSKYYSEQANDSKNAAANSQDAAAASAALAAQTVANLNAQFQNAMAALTVDSELQNIRVGADNVTYRSAGEAVRGQVNELIADVNPAITENVLDLTWTLGKIVNDTGVIGDTEYFATSDYIHVLNGDRLFDHTELYRQGLGENNVPYITYIAVYDTHKTFVKRTQFGTYTKEYACENGYVRISFGLGAASETPVNATDTSRVRIAKINMIDALRNVSSNSGTLARLLAVANTYETRIAQFTYSPLYTAWNPVCDNTLDCSSFHALLINGVTYEKSRYYTGARENMINPEFFTDMYCYPRSENGEEISGTYDPDGFPHCRYAYQQAQWLYDHGYTYVPTADMTNIEIGDTVFFSFNDPSTPPENVITWEDGTTTIIDHVAIFLGKTSRGRYMLLQFGDYEHTTQKPSTIFEFGSSMNACVLCAHIPYRFNQDLPVNISTNALGKKSADGKTVIDKIVLAEPMVPGEMYTLCFYGRINVNSKYFLLQSTEWTTIFSDSTDKGDGKEHVKTIHFVCPTLSDYTQFWLNTSGSATTGEDASYAYGIRMYKGLVDDGVVGNAVANNAIRYVNRGTLRNLLDAISEATGKRITVKSYDKVRREYDFNVEE